MWFPHQVLHHPVVISAAPSNAVTSCSPEKQAPVTAPLRIPMRLFGSRSTMTVRDANSTTPRDFISLLRYCFSPKLFSYGVTIRLLPTSIDRTFDSVLQLLARDVVKLPHRYSFREVDYPEGSSVTGDRSHTQPCDSDISIRSLLTLTEQLSLQSLGAHEDTEAIVKEQSSLCCVVISRLELEEEERRFAGIAVEEADRRSWIAECIRREQDPSCWSLRLRLHPADEILYDAVTRGSVHGTMEAVDRYFRGLPASAAQLWDDMDPRSREHAVHCKIGPRLKHLVGGFFSLRLKVSEFELSFPKGGVLRGFDSLASIVRRVVLLRAPALASSLLPDSVHFSLPGRDVALEGSTPLVELAKLSADPTVLISFQLLIADVVCDERACRDDEPFRDANDAFVTVESCSAKESQSPLTSCQWMLSTTRDALTQVYVELSRCLHRREQTLLSSRLKTVVEVLLRDFLDDHRTLMAAVPVVASQELLSLQIDLTATLRSRFGFSLDLTSGRDLCCGDRCEGIQEAVIQRWHEVFEWLSATVTSASKAQRMEEVACMAVVIAMLERFGLWSIRRYPAMCEEDRILQFCDTLVARGRVCL